MSDHQVNHGTLYSARNKENESNEQKMREADHLANEFLRGLGEDFGIVIPGV